MERLLLLIVTGLTLSARASSLVIESPKPMTVANPIVKLIARTTATNSYIRAVEIQKAITWIGSSPVINCFYGITNRLDLDIDTSPLDGAQINIVIETVDNWISNTVYIPIIAHSNPRFTPTFLAPDRILDINQNSVLYRTAAGAELAFFDGTARTISRPPYNAQSGHITPTGAVIIDPDQSLALELNGGEILTHSNVTKAKVSGDFGLLISGLDGPSKLRNFVANTHALVATPFYSADLATNGLVYLSGWQSSADTNTVLYRLENGKFVQIDPEIGHVQGRIETDGSNVLWFSAPHTLDSNNFQVYLLTATGRVHLSTNYFPIFHSWIYEADGLALVKNGWTVFPRLDENGIHQVWWRKPDGMIVQATSFATNTVALFDMRSDGAFLASVVGSTTFENHLYFVKPGSLPLDLGSRTHVYYKFAGDQLIAYTESSAVFIDVSQRTLVGVTHPQVSRSGEFSCYITASEPTTFRFQHSTDLENWSAISTNLTASAKPTKFQITAPPGFIRAQH